MEVEDWDRDVELILKKTAETRDNIVEIFDGCLSLKPQRKDIITMLMENTHVHLLTLLSNFWDSNGILLNPFETLSIIDWCYQYLN